MIVQLSGIKYIHTAVQPSPPSISRISSSSQADTLFPLNTHSLPPAPGTTIYFCVYGFDCCRYVTMLYSLVTEKPRDTKCHAVGAGKGDGYQELCLHLIKSSFFSRKLSGSPLTKEILTFLPCIMPSLALSQ